jgi:mRNA interferase YafO
LTVIVEYNKDSYDFYLKQVFNGFPGLEQQLLDDFIIYKSTGRLPDYFGRDTLYTDPSDIQDAELRHIHFEVGNDKFKLPTGWRNLTSQQLQWVKTTNTALVYTKHLLNEDHYSLIAVFTPLAHMKARDYGRMRVLAGYARKFHES